jgi:hypothetical protein
MEAYLPDADGRKQVITEFFATSGQQFLPILELLMDAKEQLHAFTHAVGVAAIEGLLELSATQVAGPPHPGKATPPTQTADGAVRRHGHQKGVVAVGSDLRVMSTVRPILVNPGGIANYIFGKHLGTKQQIGM